MPINFEIPALSEEPVTSTDEEFSYFDDTHIPQDEEECDEESNRTMTYRILFQISTDGAVVGKEVYH